MKNSSINFTKNKRRLNSLLFRILVLYFSMYGMGYSQSRSYRYGTPKQLHDGWSVASLSEVGIDVAGIEAITQRMISEIRYENVLNMLIVKDGKLVHEAYSPYCQRNTLFVLASITKTVTSYPQLSRAYLVSMQMSLRKNICFIPWEYGPISRTETRWGIRAQGGQTGGSDYVYAITNLFFQFYGRV